MHGLHRKLLIQLCLGFGIIWVSLVGLCLAGLRRVHSSAGLWIVVD